MVGAIAESTLDEFSVFERLESNVRSYCRSFPAIFVKASGSHLVDTNGNTYIDFLSGAGSLNYGHNNSVIKKALLAYIEEDGVLLGLDLYTEAKQRFITSFNQHILSPRDLRYKLQFTGPTGTNAVEAALKLARKVTGRVAARICELHTVGGESFQTTCSKWVRVEGLSWAEVDGRKIWQITDSQGGKTLARSIVLGTGRTPNVPGALKPVLGPKVFHLNNYKDRIENLPGTSTRIATCRHLPGVKYAGGHNHLYTCRHEPGAKFYSRQPVRPVALNMVGHWCISRHCYGRVVVFYIIGAWPRAAH